VPPGFHDRLLPVRPLDEEQAALLEVLCAAGGAPVTFEELHALGIDNPATLCYELEIAGLPITHVERSRLGAAPVPLGIRLEEPALSHARAWLSEAAVPGRLAGETLGPRLEALQQTARRVATSAHALAAHAVRFAQRWLAAPPDLRARARGHARLIAGAAGLLAVAGLAAGLASISGSGPRHATSYLSGLRGSGRQGPSGGTALGAATGRHEHAGTTRSATTTSRTSANRQAAAGSAPAGRAARAAAFEAQGHRLLEEGDYGAAVGKLQAALAASGGSPQRCAEPATEACLTYAYALYDLGRALALQHEPSALPVLRERLRIDNQRSAVQDALAEARAQLAPQPAPRAHARGRSLPRSRPQRGDRAPRPAGPRHHGASPHGAGEPQQGAPGSGGGEEEEGPAQGRGGQRAGGEGPGGTAPSA
jgi:hypothetical protein